MKENIDKLAGMSAADLMVFIKDCCKNNEAVTKQIAVYKGCVLAWVKEVEEFIVFTVRAGSFDGVSVRDANEYITVSFNTKTEELFCLRNYLHNYSGYNIFIPNGQNYIKQDIGYGFGSWKYNELNLDLTEKASHSKQEYGSCCG